MGMGKEKNMKLAYATPDVDVVDVPNVDVISASSEEDLWSPWV